MQLRLLRVENFRGILHATISFEQTTVFIGENDCGKSSILEALAVALGVGADGHLFAFHPVHAHRADGDPPPPIRITLTFQENEANEWNSILPKRPRLFPPRVVNPRMLMFELEAAFDADLNVKVTWGVRTRERGPLFAKNDLDLVHWLRRICPVVWLRGGVVTASHSTHAASRNVETDHLIELVERHYLDITEQSGTDPAELEKGFAAARALLLQMPFNAASASLGPVLQEITGAHRRQPSTAGPPRFHGGAAEKIGLLLLMGAVLRTGQFGLPEGAAPLVIVEDPEAHLHPMTLASVWGLLEQIRWQKIVSTHSGTLLSNAPLSSIHRLTREQGVVLDWSVAAGRLSKEELRRWGYHIRSRRASAMFARCWLFVEGETEFWLLPEFARILGFDLAVEGITCVEFAQSGLSALIKVAENLGIEWHMLADGDEAGQRYRQIAQPFMDPGQVDERITIIPERDIEHCLWHNGFAHVYRRAAYPQARRIAAGSPEAVISLAISRTSKPYLALQVLEAASALGPEKVPAPIRHAVSSCIRLARHSPLVPDSLLPE